MATGVSKRDVREHATKGGNKRECPMCALCVRSVCALYALCVRSVCALCALCVRSVCTMCARCLHDVCTMYARCAAHKSALSRRS